VIVDEKAIGKASSQSESDPEAESPVNFLRRKKGNEIKDPYKFKRDEVRLFVDPNGRLVGNIPKNVDQDDVFIITIAARRSELANYDIKVEEGEYAPSDLTLRPTEELKKDAIASSDKQVAQKDPLQLIEFRRGPFTTDHFKFTITYYDRVKEETRDLRTYAIRINKLYHAGFGVSFNKTDLGNPSYDVLPLRGTNDNTIVEINAGERSIISVHIIWYWRIFEKDFWSGSGLTKGRDILKESNFIKRIFPTFGVSLDGDYRENFFFGFVYEFARGANLNVGLHYGKVTGLADETFTLGKDVFVGTKDDIKTSSKSRTKPYWGLTVDTRAFNALLGLR